MFLKIKSGKDTGQMVPLFDFCTLGKESCDILIDDPSISSPHAKVEIQDGQYILRDQASKHGLFFENHQVGFIFLERGTTIKMGRIEFEVLGKEDIEDYTTQLEIAKKEFQKKSKEALMKKALQSLEDDQTQDSLSSPANSKNLDMAEFLKNHQYLFEDKEKTLDFLQTPIQMKFEKGAQKDLSWEIAYFPRSFGSNDADLSILDPKVQDQIFKLFLRENKVIILPYIQNLILLNYEFLNQEQPLHNNDLLIIGATYIRFYI